MNKNIYGIYFICCKGNYLEIVNEQLRELHTSGLYDNTNTKNIIIFICLYNTENIELNTIIKKYDKDNKYILVTTEKNLFEKFAINNYKNYIQDTDEYYLFYIHTKGISKHTNTRFQNIRKILNFYTLTKYKLCIKLLEQYDCVGCSLTLYPTLHFSGNFWWTTSQHVKKLPLTIGNKYLDPEMYICSDSTNTSKYISLSQTTNNAKLEKHISRNDHNIIYNLTSIPINNIEWYNRHLQNHDE
jgi:hypothetical protein